MYTGENSYKYDWNVNSNSFWDLGGNYYSPLCIFSSRKEKEKKKGEQELFVLISWHHWPEIHQYSQDLPDHGLQREKKNEKLSTAFILQGTSYQMTVSPCHTWKAWNCPLCRENHFSGNEHAPSTLHQVASVMVAIGPHLRRTQLRAYLESGTHRQSHSGLGQSWIGSTGLLAVFVWPILYHRQPYFTVWSEEWRLAAENEELNRPAERHRCGRQC